MVLKFRKIFLLIMPILILNACGGETGGSSFSFDRKKIAIEKIVYYAQNSDSLQLIKQDYIDAGIENLEKIDITELNNLIASKEPKDVDTIEKLNALVLTLVDKIAPIITLNGDSKVYIKKHDLYQDLGVTAIDDKDRNLTVSKRGKVLVSEEGIYIITYEAKDKANNKAVVRRSVYVDGTAPTINMFTHSIKEGSSFGSIASAKDNIDGDVFVSISGLNPAVPGVYTVRYTATDRVGNVSSSTNRVEVIAFTMKELFEKSKNKELIDVSYIVVGDSTRNREVNMVLVEETNGEEAYYVQKLSKLGISFEHTAYSGQRVDYWLNGNRDGEHFVYNDTKAKIKAFLTHHVIIEFSMGINDFIQGNSESKIKFDILESIEKLEKDFPNIKILLVSPVPYYKSYYDKGKDFWEGSDSQKLERIYHEIAFEKGLKLISGVEALKNHYTPVYYSNDNLHPTPKGSKLLLDYIFEKLSE